MKRSQVQTRSQKRLTLSLNGCDDFESLLKLQHEIENLKNEKETLLKNLLSMKEEQKQFRDKHWLNDDHLTTFFNSFISDVNCRDDIAFISPSTSHILRNGTFHEVLIHLTGLAFDKVNIAFICLNNATLTNDGSHWSLLVYNRPDKAVYHLDSCVGLNHEAAKQLMHNVGWNEEQLIEIPTIQQKNGFECGLHVLVNCKNIVSYLQMTQFYNLSLHSTLVGGIKSLYVKMPTKILLKEMCSENNGCKQLDKSKDLQIENKNTWITVDNTHKSKSYLKPVNNQLNFKIKCSNRFSVLQEFDEGQINITHVLPNDYNKSNLETDNSDKNKISKNGIVNLKDNPYLSSEDPKNCENRKCLKYCFGADQINAKSKLSDERKQDNLTLDDNCRSLPQKPIGLQSKIQIYSDSHGRKLREELNRGLRHNYKICSSVKPNGKVNHVLSEVSSNLGSLSENDYIIIFGGTNDVSEYSDDRVIITEIENKLNIISMSKANIIIAALPLRYDLPWLNRKINNINYCLENLCYRYCNAHFLSLNDLKRHHYTNHGIHLSNSGKRKISNSIIDLMDKVQKLKSGQMEIPVITNNICSFLDKRAHAKLKM
jgi:hypothetical protein